MYDEIIEEETKTVTTIFNEKNETCKKKICILLSFFALLIAVSIYCYLIKYKAKTYINILHHKITN